MIRFEYFFDAEILDAGIRAALAHPNGGGADHQPRIMPLMNEIRSRLEQTLAQISVLRTGIGSSELHCPGAVDIVKPNRARDH